MVSLSTASGNFQVVDGLVSAPYEPGLGITPDLDLLGEPVASYN